MNRNHVIGVVVVAILSIAWWSAISTEAAEVEASSQRTVWEYKVVNYTGLMMGAIMNAGIFQGAGGPGGLFGEQEDEELDEDEEDEEVAAPKSPFGDISAKLEEMLNEAGADGWELVSMDGGQAAFKRQKQE